MVKAERFTPSSAPMLPGAMDIGEPERAAVLSALDPAYIAKMANESPSSSCSWIYKFERAFTNAMNVRYGTATNSGTAALFASLVALGIEPGDEVIIPAYSYISCAAATLNAGGIPVIADVDASLTLDPAAVRTSLSAYTKVIMVVHMRGVPAQLTALKTIAAESRTTLVEDASQACGATYQGRPVGGHGAVGCFSFDPTKIISSDQGGMVVTDDPRIDLRVRCAADPEWQPGDDRSRCPDRPFTGLNLKMSHIAAALATAQLQRLPSLIDRMRERQALLTEAIARHGRFVMRSVPDNACEVGNSVVFFADRSAHRQAGAARTWCHGTCAIRRGGAQLACVPVLARCLGTARTWRYHVSVVGRSAYRYLRRRHVPQYAVLAYPCRPPGC
jgi:dTDP-4-amino-4,6-dideoxygalactose transaminase